MASKKKKNSKSSGHKYTTREIMDLTEQRRSKDDAVRRPGGESQDKIPENIPETAPVNIPANIPDPVPEKIDLLPPRVTLPIQILIGPMTVILWVIASLLFTSSKFSENSVAIFSAKLNALILGISYLLLRILQGSCSLEGLVLNANYYQVSLQGDMTAFYSLELLIVFGVLFAYFQKTSKQKRVMVFAYLIPIGLLANIIRVLWACGLALNEGGAIADRYFHGILMAAVFIFIILGLVLLESLSSSD